MDGTREHDLHEMWLIFSDDSQPASERRLAFKAYSEIQKQLKDKTLQSLRSRMVKARIAMDRVEGQKIADLIIEHKHRMHYGR